MQNVEETEEYLKKLSRSMLRGKFTRYTKPNEMKHVIRLHKNCGKIMEWNIDNFVMGFSDNENQTSIFGELKILERGVVIKGNLAQIVSYSYNLSPKVEHCRPFRFDKVPSGRPFPGCHFHCCEEDNGNRVEQQREMSLPGKKGHHTENELKKHIDLDKLTALEIIEITINYIFKGEYPCEVKEGL